ncbi:MAG: Bug family tripartite tricarboxylate transporter substrate binding protein [Beijerinckiaceae bacterium]
MLTTAKRILIASCAYAAGAAMASAQDVASFYKDRTVTLIVSTGAGGGYDLLARTIARHMPRHIPGAPTIVVQNMPGGGALVATNHLYSVAAKDGSVFAGLSNNTPFEPLFGTKEARYDPEKFSWLGSPSSEIGLLAVWHTVPVRSLDDARRREITVGSTGVNATPSFYARLLNETLGFNLKVIVGYKGQNEIFIAMERGELDATSSIFYSSLIATRPAWLAEKKVNLIVQYGLARQPQLDGVPFAPDLAKNADDKALMTAAFAPLSVGRPYAMPPGAPADRVAAMKKALEATFRDNEFAAEATKQQMDVSSPLSGEQIVRIIRGAYALPDAQVQRLRKLSTP